MVRVYHSANIDAVNWRIYSDNKDKVIRYFPSKTTSLQIVDQLSQTSLFDMTDTNNKVYVVNIDGWKLTDAAVKENIKELHQLPDEIIFAIESSTVKNKIFSELKIQIVKATAVTKKAKTAMVQKLLSKAKIKLDLSAEDLLVNLLPDNIHFIMNEVEKLKLMNQKTFTVDEIKKIVFDIGDATVFNIVGSWLKGDEIETIERLNDLISKNITIQAFVPIFALKLVQIKLFLSAKLAKWSSDIITAKQGLPFWQQSIYSNLRPYDKKLEMINQMLDKLYQFDINVKKQKNIPYTQLIKILFK